jgi:hypothetical protein
LNILRVSRDFEEVVAFLSHLTHPATRHVLVPFGNATVFINNQQAGSDFADYTVHVSRKLCARTARAVDSPARSSGVGTNGEVLTYETRILEVYQDGEFVRSVACMNDSGRWIFESAGEPLPVEQTFNYHARRKRDRFTCANLKALLDAFGFPFPDIEAVANIGFYVLVREQLLNSAFAERVEAQACTPAQRDDPAFGYYRRGLGWVAHMQSHAESVLADLERAAQLNPAYEPLVEKHLERAREVIRGRK